MEALTQAMAMKMWSSDGARGNDASTGACCGRALPRDVNGRRWFGAGMVAAREVLDGNVEAIPAVNGDNSQEQVHILFFIEVLANTLIEIVRNTAIGDEGDSFGELEDDTLPFCIERSFAPGIEKVDALFRFAGKTCVFGVHVKAVAAAVELRGANVDEVNEAMVKAALHDKLPEAGEGYESFGVDAPGVKAGSEGRFVIHW